MTAKDKRVNTFTVDTMPNCVALYMVLILLSGRHCLGHCVWKSEFGTVNGR